jgi:ABC-2 type transport system ATP-binding protein
MPDAITIRGLSKAYGGKNAVDGLDLDIHTGECFALLGPNGAGKTTTVEIAEGFRPRDSGEVSILGTDPQGAGLEWRNRVGIVLQSTGGLDLLTPREALASTAKAYSHPRDVADVLASVGLDDKADTRIVGLSGGQRRRLDVALGIVGRPELLFLDEPTTGFDPQARRDFWQLIRALSAEGTTILLTTHYLDEAENLADRVGVIAAGRLLAVDTPEALGGRSAEEATVSWEEDGIRRSLTTATPTAEVARLAARMPGGEVPALTVTRPSLEDTYLAMIAPHVGHETHETHDTNDLNDPTEVPA